jgi:hypothetical protein
MEIWHDTKDKMKNFLYCWTTRDAIISQAIEGRLSVVYDMFTKVGKIHGVDTHIDTLSTSAGTICSCYASGYTHPYHTKGGMLLRNR